MSTCYNFPTQLLHGKLTSPCTTNPFCFAQPCISLNWGRKEAFIRSPFFFSMIQNRIQKCQTCLMESLSLQPYFHPHFSQHLNDVERGSLKAIGIAVV